MYEFGVGLKRKIWESKSNGFLVSKWRPQTTDQTALYMRANMKTTVFSFDLKESKQNVIVVVAIN